VLEEHWIIFLRIQQHTVRLIAVGRQVYFDRLVGVSVTAHGGIINGFLQVIGRQPFGLPTGGKLILDSMCYTLIG